MGQTMKQRVGERLAATVQPAMEAGEQVRVSLPATIQPPAVLTAGVPLGLLALLILALTTLPLGALGVLIVTVVFVVLNGVFGTTTTKRYALALTDRRLVWIPWNGKAATGPPDAESASSVAVVAQQAGRFSTKLTLRRGDGTERRITIPRAWVDEAEAMAEALGGG
jgi:hypothetical protein